MSAPIGHTCPDIDAVIKDLRSIQDIAKQGMKSTGTDSDEYQMFKDCEWDIDSIISRLEDLRTSNSILRGYGEDMEGKLSDKENELYDAENKIEELEKQLQEALINDDPIL